MARGQRKSPIEKTKEELAKVINAIESYEAALVTMQAKKKELQEDLEKYEMEELIDLMKEKDLSVEQVRNILNSSSAEEKTA